MLGASTNQALTVDQLRSLRDRAGPNEERILQPSKRLVEVVQIRKRHGCTLPPEVKEDALCDRLQNDKTLVSSSCPGTTVHSRNKNYILYSREHTTVTVIPY